MGSGGMRSGAGRPAFHVKAEHCRRIDVRHWQRQGLLKLGTSGTWQWSCGETGERLASIGYWCDGATVTLSYSIEGNAQMQALALSHSLCNYGGTRPWFRCPTRGERVAVLYLRAGRFACRQCQRIAYGSQSDDPCARTWRKQAKLEAKLGPDWDRSKGMHLATHERLISLLRDCEDRRDAALSVLLGRLLQRNPSLKYDPLLTYSR